MQPHKVVSREEWVAARKTHLANEKELTRLHVSFTKDDLAKARFITTMPCPKTALRFRT